MIIRQNIGQHEHLFTLIMIILIVVSYTLPVCLSQSVSCADDELPYNGRCFYFSENIFKPRDEAIQYCKDERSSNLVSVPDEATNKFLYNNRRSNRPYWIGLRRFNNNEWGWNDGTIDLNIQWGDGQPESGTACARMPSSGLYYTDDCDNNYPFICEQGQEPFERNQNWTEYNGHWYYWGGYSTHLSAVHKCLEVGGYLARLTTDGEIEFASQSSNIWTGLTVFVWDDGTGYSWHDWPGGSADNYPTTTGCTSLDDSPQGWRSKDCTLYLNFICAYGPTSTIKPTTITTASTMTTTTTPITTTIVTTTKSSPTTTTTSTTVQTSKPILTSTSTFAPMPDQSTANSTSQTRMNTPTRVPVSNTTSNVKQGTTEQSPTMGDTTLSYIGEQPTTERVNSSNTLVDAQIVSKEDKALEYVLYIICTLVGIMIVTDSVLLVVYLKLKNNFESTFDDVSRADDAKYLYEEVTEACTVKGSTCSSSPAQNKTISSTYYLPKENPPRQGHEKQKLTTMYKGEETENPYPKISSRQITTQMYGPQSTPVYAVPHKINPHELTEQ